ncbi:MAG: CdaR family protein [Bacillota bacterium]
MDRWLGKDFALKVVSIVIAVVLWLQVTNELNPVDVRTYRGVEVKYVNLGTGLVVTEAAPGSVNVTLRGGRRVLDSLSESKLTAQVSLSSLGPGKNTVPISVVAPQGCEVAEVSPPESVVTLEAIASRAVNVEVRIVGSPQEDYAADPPRPASAQVTVRGPESKVAIVRKAMGVVDITGQTISFTRGVSLKAVDQEGKEVPGVSVEPQTVNVYVPMKTLPPARMVQVRAQVVGQPASGYKVSEVQVEPSVVKVRGPSDLIGSLEWVNTLPVDVSGRASDVEVQTQVSLPSWATMSDSRTVTVRVRIVEDLVERNFSSVPVRLRSLSSGFRWLITPSEVSVTVSAKKDLLGKLNTYSVEAYVDARGLGEGEHEIPVQVVLPENVSLVNVSPDKVKLSLKPR